MSNNLFNFLVNAGMLTAVACVVFIVVCAYVLGGKISDADIKKLKDELKK